MQILLTYIIPLFLSSFCDQEFQFVGITKSNINVPTIAIIENVGGQCYYSKLIQIAVAETSVSVVESNFKEYKKTAQFVASFTAFNQLSFIALGKVSGGEHDILTLGFEIIEPAPDSIMFAKSFTDGIRLHPTIVKLPTFGSTQAKLLYCYNEGLYVNYHIDKAVFVPSYHILIVFTKHPMLGPGGDTMHGFMIFRLQH
jgi:hypothetical protein